MDLVQQARHAVGGVEALIVAEDHLGSVADRQPAAQLAPDEAGRLGKPLQRPRALAVDSRPLGRLYPHAMQRHLPGDRPYFGYYYFARIGRARRG